MNQLFEGFRRWGTLTEEQLLVESILKDAKKKYPNVDPNWVDRLSERDPSEKNKYLMWATKQFAKMTDEYREENGGDLNDTQLAHAIYPIYQGIANTVDQFHANYQRLKSKKISTDINTYKTIDQINDILKKLGLTQKLQRAKKREIAQEGSTNLYENDYFWMIRPDTTEASCYYGQGTKWCISAKQATNYFKQYTNEGKTFYMIMMKNLDDDDDGKKMALVYTRDQYMGTDMYPDEIYDAVDDSIDDDDFGVKVTKNIIGGYFADYEKVYEEFEEFTSDPTDENLTENIKKLAIEMLKSGEYETEIDADDIETPNPDELAEAMANTFQRPVSDLFHIAAQHSDDNPTGPTEEDYQEVLDAHELENVHVNLDDNGEGTYYYEASVGWELPDGLVYALSEDGEQTDFDDWADDIEQIFKDVADNHYIYPNETDYSSYNSDPVINFRIYPEGHEVGSTDAFDNWLDEMDEIDSKYDQVLEDVLEEMADQGITVSPEHEARKAAFGKLQRLKNFEATFEKGRVTIIQPETFEEEFPLAKAMGISDLASLEPRPDDRKIADNSERKEWIKGQLQQGMASYERWHAFGAGFKKSWELWAGSLRKSAKAQQSLPLQELKLKAYATAYEDIVMIPGEEPEGDFSTYEIDLENGGTVSGNIKFWGLVPGSAFMDYIYWLDDNMDIFYDGTIHYILKHFEAKLASNKSYWPEKFKAEEEEAVTENVSYERLCESWRRWATK